MAEQYVAYYRVSTVRQGRSGLGMEAQEAAVSAFLAARGGTLLGEAFVEVESGKRDDNRPQLQEALRLCRVTRGTLLVAKLDRLSRDAAFLMTLSRSGVRFVAADMPDANDMTVGIMALVAQQEREAISARTKAALAAAKARGVKLGGDRGHTLPAKKAALASAAIRSRRALQRALDIREIIEEARAAGAVSLRQIAAALNDRDIRTPRGSSNWSAAQVKAVLDRTPPTHR